jgi:hypothetical protein
MNANYAGSGLEEVAGSPDSLAIDLIDADDQVGSSSNQSGMEFGGTGGTDLGLLRNCGNGQILKFNTTGGLWECQNDDDSGGSPAWEALVNTADTATSFTGSADAETVTFDFQSAFAADRFIIQSSTGNPTAGDLLALNIHDTNVTPFHITANTFGTGEFTIASNMDMTVDNNADSALTWLLTAGSTAEQTVQIRLNDRASNEWTIGKTATQFLVIDVGVANRIAFTEAGLNAYNTGSTSTDHLFGDSAGTVRARILGDAPTLCLGTAENTCLNESASGILDVTNVVDANTGFRIAGAAAATNALIGDGTNFVAGQISSSQLATANKGFSKSITVLVPTTTEDDYVQWMHETAVTYTDVDCSTDVGTVTIDMDHRVITTPNTVGTDILTGTIVCDTDNQADGGFADATIPANVPVNLSITATASSPQAVRIHIRGTID